MIFFKEDLEKNGIKDYEDFEEIKFKLKIDDYLIDDDSFYGYTNNLLAEHEITLNPWIKKDWSQNSVSLFLCLKAALLRRGAEGRRETFGIYKLNWGSPKLKS